jgi:hypothetical protein
MISKQNTACAKPLVTRRGLVASGASCGVASVAINEWTGASIGFFIISSIQSGGVASEVCSPYFLFGCQRSVILGLFLIVKVQLN